MGTHLAQDDTLIFSIYIGWDDLFWVKLSNFNIFGVFSKNDNFCGWIFSGSLLILIILMSLFCNQQLIFVFCDNFDPNMH